MYSLVELRFDVDRSLVTERVVEPFPIIEYLDLLEDHRASLDIRFVAA